MKKKIISTIVDCVIYIVILYIAISTALYLYFIDKVPIINIISATITILGASYLLSKLREGSPLTMSVVFAVSIISFVFYGILIAIAQTSIALFNFFI